MLSPSAITGSRILLPPLSLFHDGAKDGEHWTTCTAQPCVPEGSYGDTGPPHEDPRLLWNEQKLVAPVLCLEAAVPLAHGESCSTEALWPVARPLFRTRLGASLLELLSAPTYKPNRNASKQTKITGCLVVGPKQHPAPPHSHQTRISETQIPCLLTKPTSLKILRRKKTHKKAKWGEGNKNL